MPNEEAITVDAGLGTGALSPLEARQNIDMHWHRFYLGKQDLANFVEPTELLEKLSSNVNYSGTADHAGSLNASRLNLDAPASKFKQRIWLCHIKRSFEGFKFGCRV